MKILVTEDSERLCRSLEKGFQGEGIYADFAKDGEQGLSLSLGISYDVIILDIMLPKLDGLEILKTLRHKGIQTPILILSSKRQTSDRVAGLKLGADDYLTKPFAFDELCARIKALNRRHHAKGQPLLTVRNLTIDSDSASALCGDQLLPLTRSEYQILECLVFRRGRVVTKETLKQLLHEIDWYTQSNIIESLICTLRKKLSASCSDNKDLVQTKRGFGYIIY